MFRQKQNCRSDSILISVDKKVCIVYKRAFGNTGSLFYVPGNLVPITKNVQWGCTIFDSHTEMIYGIIKTAERSECPSAREISDFSGVHCNLKLII